MAGRPRISLACLALLLFAAAAAHAQGVAINTSGAASGPATPALVIDGGGTRVTIAAATRFVVDCDVRNYGSFEPNTASTVVVTGFGSPTFVNTSFGNLQLALHGTASLANDATANGTVTLGSGWLSLAGHDLTIDFGVVGGSPASYLVTPDTLGRVVRSVDAGTNVLFPVGHAAYDPVTLRTGAGSDLFRVAVLDAPPTAGVAPAEALTRAWAIAHPNAAGVNGALTASLQWNAAETGAGFVRSVTAANGAKAWRWSGTAWLPKDNVRTWDNGAWPAVDSLVTLESGLWTLAGNSALADAGPAADAAPRALELAPASPNPFRGATTVRFGLPKRAHVMLSLYSVLGERAVTLADGERSAGWHVVRLEDARLANGVYFLRLQAGAETRTEKVVVMR